MNLTESEETELKEMLAWWRARKAGSWGQVDSRPVFRGPRSNSSFHCNSELMKRAKAKLKTEPLRTGGSFSKLIEVLLWDYLECPADVLEITPTGDQDVETENNS